MDNKIWSQLVPELMGVIFTKMWMSYDLDNDNAMDDIAAISRTSMISQQFHIILPEFLASRACTRIYVIGTRLCAPLITTREVLFSRATIMPMFGTKNRLGMGSSCVDSRLGVCKSVRCVFGIHACRFIFDKDTKILLLILRSKGASGLTTVYKKGTSGSLHLAGFPLFAARLIESLFPREICSPTENPRAMAFLIQSE